MFDKCQQDVAKQYQQRENTRGSKDSSCLYRISERGKAPLNRSPADLTAGGMPEKTESHSIGTNQGHSSLEENTSERITDPRLAAAHFIAQAYPWQIMLTVTNSPYGGESVTATAKGARESIPHFVSEESAERRFRNGINKLNRAVFGSNYTKYPTKGFTWAGTMEFQKSGNPHHHALLYTPHWEAIAQLLNQKRVGNKILLPQVEQPFRDAGAGPIIRAEICLNPHQASQYITKACKYITKTDGLSYGGNWNA